MNTAGVEASYVDEVLLDAPVAYYRLEEASGSLTAVNSGTGSATLDGTFLNFPDPATADAGIGLAGWVDLAAHFNPDTLTHVEVPDNDLLDITGALTLEAWVKVDAISNNSDGIINKYGGGTTYGNNRSYGLDVNSVGNVVFLAGETGDFGGVTQLNSTTVPEVDTWMHVAAVFDPGTAASGDSTMKIYINGALDASLAGGPDALFVGTAPLWLGTQYDSSLPSTTFDGFIDEAAVYATALSADRIKAHYAEAPIPEPGSGLLLMLGFSGWLTLRHRKARR